MLGAHTGPGRLPAAALRLPARPARASGSCASGPTRSSTGSASADLAGNRPRGLPYGTLKRVELARALAADPVLLHARRAGQRA